MDTSNTVVCVGELLIDFFCKDVDVSLVQGNVFEKQAGGAPANVSAAISRLGGSASFVGVVGDEPFGHFLKGTLDAEKVDTSMLYLTKEAPTTLAFVSLKRDGERDFIFNRGADQLLTYEKLDVDKLNEASILHFGSATALLNDPFQATYFKMIKDAYGKGAFISFDPNYRHALWGGRVEEFVELSKRCIAKADFVKVSEEELALISGTEEKQKGLSALHNLGAKMVAVTLGKRGTLISDSYQQEVIPSIKIKSIDSTGAGDAFVGATLFQFSRLENPKKMNDFTKLKEIVTFANTVGAIVCTKLGAISSLPNIDEVKKYLTE